MPKRRRHQPGRYKQQPPLQPIFTGPKPLTVFQAENGMWGAKDAEGHIEIEPAYNLVEAQNDYERDHHILHLVSRDTVLMVTPDDWDMEVWFSADLFE